MLIKQTGVVQQHKEVSIHIWVGFSDYSRCDTNRYPSTVALVFYLFFLNFCLLTLNNSSTLLNKAMNAHFLNVQAHGAQLYQLCRASSESEVLR